MNSAVYAIATMDTKGHELQFVANRLQAVGATVRTVDVGTLSPPVVTPDISRETVLAGRRIDSTGHRADSITAMSEALQDYLSEEHRAGRIAGVLGLGGSSGTALITAALQPLPIGLPKLVVSTIASGQTASYIDCSDIVLMPSVVDIAGLNIVSETILANAAHAMAGMVAHHRPATETRPCIGMTMFGVTTPCVTAVRQSLEQQGYGCLVFHATGTGGRAMENLVRSGLIEGVLDLTTTEVADEVVGGVFPAGPGRFDALVERDIPLVLSVGAVDMVNIGAAETVPERFRSGRLYQHNAQITLMRTTVEENVRIARWIANKLNRSHTRFTLLLPEGGVSLLDVPGGPFHDPQADAALFRTLEEEIQPQSGRRIVRLPYAINDPQFAAAAVREFQALGARVALPTNQGDLRE